MPKHAFMQVFIFYADRSFEEKTFLTHAALRRYLYGKDCIVYKIRHGRYVEIYNKNFSGLKHLEGSLK